ncbi:MAG TPA: methyltransferase domain-containing protein [Oligoflexia bacterium]|nr:methyltransferase domain-containing protein [Oligoflexia bacterium]HMP26577.1 methyltransferase domain-containing protein [Oligoflexia bacterium]
MPTQEQKINLIARTEAGLKDAALDELKTKNIISNASRITFLKQKNFDLLFIQNCNKPILSKTPLYTIDQILIPIIYGRFKISKNQLNQLTDYLKKQTGAWRLVTTADGAHFNRKLMAQWLTRQLKERKVFLENQANSKQLHSKIKSPANHQDKISELWFFLIDENFYVASQLFRSDTLPHRQQRIAERQGSLQPTIAAAIYYLTKTKITAPTILDPCCGTGTLLSETLAQSPLAKVIGIDIDPQATKAAIQNLQNFKQQTLILRANSSKIPLNSNIVDLVISNFPFGKQFGAPETNPELYFNILNECARVTKNNSQLVILTSDENAITSSVNQLNLSIKKKIKVKTQGLWSLLFFLEKKKSKQKKNQYPSHNHNLHTNLTTNNT